MQDTKIVYSQIYNKRMDAVVSSLLSILVIYQEAELRDHMITTFLTSKLPWQLHHFTSTSNGQGCQFLQLLANMCYFLPSFTVVHENSGIYRSKYFRNPRLPFPPLPPSWQCFFFSENTDSGSRLLVNIKYKLL